MTIKNISTESEARDSIERAIRLQDRTSAQLILSLAESKGWDVASGARSYLEHAFSCPVNRIEIIDHSVGTRPGDPGHGITTTRCMDCGSHRAHDGTGLPLATAAALAPTPAVTMSAAPAARGSRK
ncbi:hypothetical protein [Microbacterium lacus]|uniref:hypothetical protein n=1 Tax=Microbacterium lacus TaxID=415217 RepID=UPI000C2B96A0|nr:hypothetical protein [Microbacterium lacus]